MRANPNAARCPSHEELVDCLSLVTHVDEQLEQHLADCPACRGTLNDLAGESTWWDQAEKFLSGETNSDARRIARSVCALSGAAGSESQEAALLAHEVAQFQHMLEPASHPELLGRIGRYELEQLVGRGGMGLVFRGHDSELHRVVAIKTIAAHLNPQGAARERFVREARACASLTHPHIVAVYDVVTEAAVPAIVMQYVAGPTLQQRLAEHGPMPWREVLQIGIQLSDALATAHDHGLVHRDIKPGNVLLEAGGTRALLTDFGLVRALDDATLTHTGALAGTPDFMSPEQAKGQPLDGRSDLFSFGSLLYTMLTGHPPFRAPEPLAILNRLCHERQRAVCQVDRDVPVELSRLVDRLLAKQPRRRHATAGDVRDHLQHLAQSSIRLSARRPGWRQVVATGGIVAVFALIALCFGPGFMGWFDSETSQTKDRFPSAILPDGQDHGETTHGAPARPRASSATDGFVDLQRVDRRIMELNLETKNLEQSLSPLPVEQVLEMPGLDRATDGELQQIRRELGRLEFEIR